MLPRKKNGLHFTVLNSKQGCDEEEIAAVGEKYWKASNGFFLDSFADRQRERKILLVLEEEKVTTDMVSTLYPSLQVF